MAKSQITLALYALEPEDCNTLNQLLSGLHFSEPVQVTDLNTHPADIVLLDGDHQAGKDLIASGEHLGEFITLSSHHKLIENGTLLERPIRARQLLNCINSIIEKLH